MENDREVLLHQTTARIIKCNCEHEYQDERYGKGKRLHNQGGKESNLWRCTVCSNVTKQN